MADLSEFPRLVETIRREVMEPGLSENEVEQLLVYFEAFKLFKEREAKYHSLWKQYGAVDSYQHMRSKCARTQFLLEGFTDDQDDPLDLINYSAFFLRNLRAGRISSVVTESVAGRTLAVAQEDIKAGDNISIDLSTGKAVRA